MEKEIVKQIFPEMAKRVENGQCPVCGEEIDSKEFKDELSRKEFRISGMCQECQDKTFKDEK